MQYILTRASPPKKKKYDQVRQLRHMRTIYEKAESVVIWVGEEEESDVEVFETIEAFKNAALGQIENTGDGYDETLEELFYDPESTVWKSLSLLLNRPWYNRVVGLTRSNLGFTSGTHMLLIYVLIRFLVASGTVHGTGQHAILSRNTLCQQPQGDGYFCAPIEFGNKVQ